MAGHVLFKADCVKFAVGGIEPVQTLLADDPERHRLKIEMTISWTNSAELVPYML